MNNEEKILAILEQHSKMFEKMQDDITGMQDDITGVKLRLELDVEKRFNAVNEGIDALEKRLDTLDEVRELAEETREKVDVIHSVVVRHSQDIAELKKAQ